ncbi:MAG: tetratricopeptide repeat protein [candidate division WOR-3 bacterium]|nr:tetratricopeptide repeat protein [candidate division WOR-3 bacterium]
MLILIISQITRQDTAKMWFSVAKDYFQKNQFQSAIENYKRALSYDDKFLPAYLELALSYVAIKQADSALMVYEKITKLFPERPEGYQGLGYIYGYIKNDYQKSIENYKKALEIDHNNETIMKLLLGVCEKAKNYTTAESLYVNLLKKYPNDKKLLKSYVQILVRLERYKDVSDKIEELYSIDSSDKEIIVLGYSVNQRLQNENVKLYKPRYLKYLERLYSLEPNNVDYLDAIVNEAISDKNYKKAVNYLENYLKANENSSVYLKLGTIYFEYLKNYSKAEELFNRAISLAQREGQSLVIAFANASLGDIYLDRAQSLFNNEKYSDAIKLYDVAINYYTKSLNTATGTLKNYVSEQLERARKYRQTSWRRANNIE